jgi:Protein of unknown function (DUF3089)
VLGSVFVATTIVAVFVVAIPAGAAAPMSAHQRAASVTSAQGTVWLCRPGLADDPCTKSLDTTTVAADGSQTTEEAAPSTNSPYDCFYVYPTVSTESGLNANLAVQPAETAVARDQASPFSQVCRVWAPMYRQATAADLVKGIPSFSSHAMQVSYQSLLSAWRDYLAHDNDGRPIIFIGHSQGAALLIRLLATQVDSDPALRSRTILAILAGGNLQVPDGQTVGATFSHLTLCTQTGQAGCVIAYSSFPSKPPKGSPFGRPGKGVSLQSGQDTSAGQQVACVNPAALGGGTAVLVPYFLTASLPTLSPAVHSPWVTFPGLYSATCEHTGDATWLQVTTATSSGNRPLVTESLGPAWGYHADDINLALGNLVGDVSAAEATYTASH